MTRLSEKLEAAMKAGTQGDLSTAEQHIECEVVECPLNLTAASSVRMRGLV